MGKMDDSADCQLLRKYAEQSDQAAFHALVERYADLVYSAALRQVASTDLAADITQGVFLDWRFCCRPMRPKLPLRVSWRRSKD